MFLFTLMRDRLFKHNNSYILYDFVLSNIEQ